MVETKSAAIISNEPMFERINGVVGLRPKFLAEIYLEHANKVEDPQKSARFLLLAIRNLEEVCFKTPSHKISEQIP